MTPRSRNLNLKKFDKTFDDTNEVSCSSIYSSYSSDDDNSLYFNSSMSIEHFTDTFKNIVLGSMISQHQKCLIYLLTACHAQIRFQLGQTFNINKKRQISLLVKSLL